MHLPARTGKVVGIVAFVAVCLSILVWLFTLAGGRAPGSSSYEVTVNVPDGFQLVQNADVRAAGAKIGRVEDVTNDGGTAKVRISIKEDHAPLYKDATVRLRTKTLVGENYLDLTPGNPKSGEIADGGTLPMSRAGEAVQLDEILSSVDAPTRRAMQRNLDALGDGVDGRGPDLNRIFGQLEPTVHDASRLLGLLDRQRAQVSRLVDNAGKTLAAVSSRGAAVRELATGLKATAEAAASRDEQLAETFKKLPGTLAQTEQTTRVLGGVARRAVPVAADLRVGVESLEPVTARLRKAAIAGQELFDVLPSFSKRADPLLASLRGFADDATPLLAPVDAVLRQANPILRYMVPYGEEMGTMFANSGSATSSRDAQGNLLRVHLVEDEGTVTGLPRPLTDAVNGLIAAGGLSHVKGRVGVNAYPKPGMRDTPRPGDGSVPKLTPDPSALGKAGSDDD
ncbi:MlaD family protein [Patulibacter sp. NPDC049589]|uniref:MlaD family protein n=1 Tax=Patulibacter sp. NPDC049589 TaxID=3154731 RepID=UPI00343A8E2D